MAGEKNSFIPAEAAGGSVKALETGIKPDLNGVGGALRPEAVVVDQIDAVVQAQGTHAGIEGVASWTGDPHLDNMMRQGMKPEASAAPPAAPTAPEGAVSTQAKGPEATTQVPGQALEANGTAPAALRPDYQFDVNPNQKDSQGRLINENGQMINDQGFLVDSSNRRIDTEGNLVDQADIDKQKRTDEIRVNAGGIPEVEQNKAIDAEAERRMDPEALAQKKAAEDQKTYDELKEKPYKELTPADKKFMSDQEAKLANQVSAEDKDWYDEAKEKAYKDLSEGDKKRMREIEGKMESADKPLTPEQLQQKKEELIGKMLEEGPNVENIKALKELNEKQAGEGTKLSEAEKQQLVEKILNPEANDAVMKEVRENILEMKRIEMQLLMQGETIKVLRQERKAAVEAAKTAVDKANKMNLDNGNNLTSKGEARDKAYTAMMLAMQKRAQISMVKLQTGKLIAEHEDRNQFVMRKTGVTGGFGAIMDMVGSKMGLVGSEINYRVNSMIDGSAFDSDESIHIPGIGQVIG